MNVRRNLKHIVGAFTPIQVKTREATSNDPWGPPTALLSEISDACEDLEVADEVFQIVWKRLGDDGKNWRHVYKCLILLDYLIKTGPMSAVESISSQMYVIVTLKDFQFEDKDGKDRGTRIREKARQVAALLKDPDHLREQRSAALQVKGTFQQKTTSVSGDIDSPEKNRTLRSASVTALSGQEKHLESPTAVSEEPTRSNRSVSSAAALIARGPAANDPWAAGPTSQSASPSLGAVSKSAEPLRRSKVAQAPAQTAANVPGSGAKVQNDPWATPQRPRSVSAMHGSGTTESQSLFNMSSAGSDGFGSPAFAQVAASASSGGLASQTFDGSQRQHMVPYGARQSLSVDGFCAMDGRASSGSIPSSAEPSASPSNTSVPFSPAPAALGASNGSPSPSPTPVLEVEEDKRAQFLDDKASALVDLYNVLNVKEKPSPPKGPTSLNEIRYNCVGSTGKATATIEAPQTGPLLPNPLIPAPLLNQPRIQPGQTWAPAPQSGYVSMTPPAQQFVAAPQPALGPSRSMPFQQQQQQQYSMGMQPGYQQPLQHTLSGYAAPPAGFAQQRTMGNPFM